MNASKMWHNSKRWVRHLVVSAVACATLGVQTIPASAATSPVLADFFVSADHPTQVFSAWDAFLVNSRTEAYLEFDVTKVIPAGTKAESIAKVNLLTYAAWVDAPGQVEVVRVPGTLSETGTTYSNRPANTGRGSGTVVTLTTSQQPVLIDVTKDFQAAVREQATRIRFAVLPGLQTPNVAVQFYARESGRHSAELDITLLPTAASQPVANLFNAPSMGTSSCSNVCAIAGAVAVASASNQVCMSTNGAWASFEQYYQPNSSGIGPYFERYYGCGGPSRTSQCACRKF